MSDTSLSSSSTASSSPSKDGITHRAGRNRLTQNHFLGSTFFGSNGGMAGSASFDPETSPSFAIRSGECKMTDDGKGASPGKNKMEVLHVDKDESTARSGADRGLPKLVDAFFDHYCKENPEFFKQCFKFFLCFTGLQVSYLTWGYMQELIMTTQFNPTKRVPKGLFPSAAFCVFSNRFLAVIVALVAVRLKHGAFFSRNTAPLWAFTPCALSNTVSSWSQYRSLKYVSFPVQTIFKSSKIIPVMCMGKVLQGKTYSIDKYVEALLITLGVGIFSLLSRSGDGGKDNATELQGLFFLIMYITADSFTSQWQDKLYTSYGRSSIDPYQMMLGVNVSAICITTAGLIVTGDIPVLWEFLRANPLAFRYNVITAITSASGQLFIFYTIKEFGPIVFTIIMTTRQMLSICISAVVFSHPISPFAALGAILVFAVLFYQVYTKYTSRPSRKTDQQAEETIERESLLNSDKQVNAETMEKV